MRHRQQEVAVPTGMIVPGKSWLDPRFTVSGIVQIVLLLVAVFKFGSEIDKRTSLIEQTLVIHSAMIRENHEMTMTLSDSNRRIATIIEQYQSQHFKP
jgi:hypothetical protein